MGMSSSRSLLEPVADAVDETATFAFSLNHLISPDGAFGATRKHSRIVPDFSVVHRLRVLL